MAAIKYQAGQILGQYGVIYLEEVEPHITPCRSKQRRALFQCPYCSNTFISRIQDVKQGKTRSCGCFHDKLNHDLFFIDITGKRFGNLTVLYHLTDDCTKWVCQCDCNNIIVVPKQNLTSGNTTSCGCKRIHTLKTKFVKDISNQRFGKLTALYPINNKGKRIWHCKCDCGNECDVQIDYLTTGNTTSCGCQKSKGEERLSQILSEIGIKFIRQCKFDDCINPKTKFKLPFDFYLPDYNCCIEYDGVQHFHPIQSWGGEQAFQDIQKRDKIKNDYCLQKQIPLIRIAYSNYDALDDSYIQRLIETATQKGGIIRG